MNGKLLFKICWFPKMSKGLPKVYTNLPHIRNPLLTVTLATLTEWKDPTDIH